MAQLSQTYTAPAVVHFNATEIVAVEDDNDSQLLLLRRLAQLWEHTLAGGATLRTFGDALLATADGLSMDVTVTGGAPVLFDLGADPGGTDPQFLLHQLGADDTFTVDAADATNPRIDVLSAKVEDEDFGDPETRIYKDPATDEILSQSFNKRRRTKLTVTYTPGTPAASPVAPSPPAGEVVFAEIAVVAGVTEIEAGDVTDLRSRYGDHGQRTELISPAAGVAVTGTPLEISGSHIQFEDDMSQVVEVPLRPLAGERIRSVKANVQSNGDTVTLSLLKATPGSAASVLATDSRSTTGDIDLVGVDHTAVDGSTYFLRLEADPPAAAFPLVRFLSATYDRQIPLE